MIDLMQAFQTGDETEAKFKAMVIGDPIAHSLSPNLHEFWLKNLGIDGAYGRLHILPSQLEAFVQELRDSNIKGCNVTLPYKENIAALVDEVTPTAEAIGAVNTLYFQQDRLIGHNTDSYGFTANLDAGCVNWDKTKDGNKSALVLGAGGAARSILYALIIRGFTQIYLANRTRARAEQLSLDFNPLATQHHSEIMILDEEKVPTFSDHLDLVVNTTSLGMQHGEEQTDQLPFNINIDALAQTNPSLCVTDIVYTPLETPLLRAAKKAKLQTVDGLGMLLHQAVPGFEKWFGQKPEVTEGLRAHILANLT